MGSGRSNWTRLFRENCLLLARRRRRARRAGIVRSDSIDGDSFFLFFFFSYHFCRFLNAVWKILFPVLSSLWQKLAFKLFKYFIRVVASKQRRDQSPIVAQSLPSLVASTLLLENRQVHANSHDTCKLTLLT